MCSSLRNVPSPVHQCFIAYSHAVLSQITNVPGSVATIVSILERYSSQCTAPSVASSGPASSGPQGEDQEGGGSSTTHKSASAVLSRAAHLEDCIIKLLRLVANLAIHPEVWVQSYHILAEIPSHKSITENQPSRIRAHLPWRLSD